MGSQGIGFGTDAPPHPAPVLNAVNAKWSSIQIAGARGKSSRKPSILP
jgi:hypothetical protein